MPISSLRRFDRTAPTDAGGTHLPPFDIAAVQQAIDRERDRVRADDERDALLLGSVPYTMRPSRSLTQEELERLRVATGVQHSDVLTTETAMPHVSLDDLAILIMDEAEGAMPASFNPRATVQFLQTAFREAARSRPLISTGHQTYGIRSLDVNVDGGRGETYSIHVGLSARELTLNETLEYSIMYTVAVDDPPLGGLVERRNVHIELSLISSAIRVVE